VTQPLKEHPDPARRTPLLQVEWRNAEGQRKGKPWAPLVVVFSPLFPLLLDHGPPLPAAGVGA